MAQAFVGELIVLSRGKAGASIPGSQGIKLGLVIENRGRSEIRVTSRITHLSVDNSTATIRLGGRSKSTAGLGLMNRVEETTLVPAGSRCVLDFVVPASVRLEAGAGGSSGQLGVLEAGRSISDLDSIRIELRFKKGAGSTRWYRAERSFSVRDLLSGLAEES